MPPETIQFALKGFEVDEQHKPLAEEDPNPVLEGGFLKGDRVQAPVQKVSKARPVLEVQPVRSGEDKRGGFMANSNPDA